MDYAQLNGVEIFKVGTHNGDTYTSQDIDDIIDSFHQLDYQPALKLGHDKSPGAPAVGYISKLWRKGDTLMADFADIPEKVFGAIKEKMFNRVSAEIWFNLERAGKKYRRALKALALLGAEVPAVAGLKPLADSFSDFHGELHYSTEEFAFSTDDVTRAASAAEKRGDETNGAKAMSADKDQNAQLAELLKKFEALQSNIDEERKKREAAEKRLAELTESNKDKDKDKDTDGGDLTARLAKMSQDEKSQTIADLSSKLDAALSAQAAEREARELAEKRSASLEERTKKLEESQRKERLDKLADKCVIPALRPFVRQFSDLATRAPDLRVYNETSAKMESALDSVERFITYVNQNAKRLFSVVSTERSGERVYDGTAADEVDRRVKRYMDENKNVSYTEAMRRVLDTDEQLKQEYATGGA